MTFAATNMQKISSGGAIGSGANSVNSIWHYSSNELLSTIAASGFFNSYTTYLTKGDLIFVSGDVDGTPATNCYMVNSETGAATVTVVGFSTVTQTYNARYTLNTDIALTDGATGHIVAPYNGTISAIYTVLKGGAVATNNATCTFKINGTNITNGVVTVAFNGSAIGDMDSATPTANNTVVAGDVISCNISNTPGGSRTAMTSILITA